MRAGPIGRHTFAIPSIVRSYDPINIMRLVLAIILLPGLLCPTLYAQDPEAARELTREGVRLHEAGSYEEAIKQFNAALKKDKDNFHAMAEKANTLEAMGSYEDCIALTERALQIHGANEEVSILPRPGQCPGQNEKAGRGTGGLQAGSRTLTERPPTVVQ